MERRAAAEIVLGLGIAALGAFILYETQAIRVIPIYAKVGPRDIPTMVGAILALLGLVLAWQGWRARSETRLAPPVPADAPGSLLDSPGTGGSTTEWIPLGVIAIGLVFQLLFFVPGDLASLIGSGAPAVEAPQDNPISAFLNAVGGFIPTATVVFVCTAIAFGSRRYVRDILIGLALAIVAYVGFVHALGLNLPAGLSGSLLAAPMEKLGGFIGSLR
jgi:putative tricarboxylic transport membrane protein